MPAWSGQGSRWGVRDLRSASGMGAVLHLGGLAVHACLIIVLGPAFDRPAAQWTVLVYQASGVVLVVGLRGRLPASFWSWSAVAATPAVSVVAAAYPGSTVLVPPFLLLTVLLTSATLDRTAAQVVAVEALIAVGWTFLRDRDVDGLVVVEVLVVVGALTAAHLLVVRQVETQGKLLDALASAAHHDALTGLRTRRAFDAALTAELGDAGPGCASLLLVDVDNFKAINDTYGHGVGDLALQHIADLLTRGVRSADAVVGRIGGDELAVMVRDCPPSVAIRRAEELVALVRGEPVILADGGPLALSISVGVATDRAGDVAGLYAAADEALYAAKSAGRGRARATASTSGLGVAEHR